MDIIDEGFEGVPIFYGVRWAPLHENGVFKLGDVALEAWFLHCVGFPVPVSGLALASVGLPLLLHLGFVPHGDVFTRFSIMLRRMMYHSY